MLPLVVTTTPFPPLSTRTLTTCEGVERGNAYVVYGRGGGGVYFHCVSLQL
jgi:hypothetical protein